MELLKYLDTESDKLHEENISSSDEFRTVNHSFLEGFNYALAIVQGFEIKLNENQQIVLEWLKDDFKESGNPIDSLESLANEVLHVETFQTCISSTYDDLSINEQFQVLAAFAEWGMKNDQ